MEKIIGAAATSLFLSLASPSTVASPIFTYGFNVTSYDCFLPGCVEESYFKGKLESMTLHLTPQAVTDGQANLHYTTMGWGGPAPWSAPNTANQGFSSVGLNAWNVSLDLDQGICQSIYLCNVDANLDVSEFLQGLFRLDTNFDNVYMSSSASNTWSGYIYSDGPYQTHTPGAFPTFTGEWQLQRVVPETGALVLFLTALAGVGFCLRHKRRPKPVRMAHSSRMSPVSPKRRIQSASAHSSGVPAL